MGKRLLTDELCEAIEPLLPKEPPKKPKGRRPRLPYQAALAGIIYRAQQQEEERYPLADATPTDGLWLGQHLLWWSLRD